MCEAGFEVLGELRELTGESGIRRLQSILPTALGEANNLFGGLLQFRIHHRGNAFCLLAPLFTVVDAPEYAVV